MDPLPSVLEPDLDLLRLDVGEDGALPYELLSLQGAGLRALVVDPLERIYLLWSIPHVLPRLHRHRLLLALPRLLTAHNHRHLAPSKHIPKNPTFPHPTHLRPSQTSHHLLPAPRQQERASPRLRNSHPQPPRGIPASSAHPRRPLLYKEEAKEKQQKAKRRRLAREVVRDFASPILCFWPFIADGLGNLWFYCFCCSAADEQAECLVCTVPSLQRLKREGSKQLMTVVCSCIMCLIDHHDYRTKKKKKKKKKKKLKLKEDLRVRQNMM
ncbi:hypothetical protein B296_00032903 [Ensete ventricosum]|uniref:Uncharacterized protein n=1 Tax=Ensete ventricosum TaxID=4639 RepID=A0A426XPG2_ENSVE|nr:hypothetical protein B296_00032903 [Ensete ventricosum]